jgi:hypothetical protein
MCIGSFPALNVLVPVPKFPIDISIFFQSKDRDRGAGAQICLFDGFDEAEDVDKPAGKDRCLTTPGFAPRQADQAQRRILCFYFPFIRTVDLPRHNKVVEDDTGRHV